MSKENYNFCVEMLLSRKKLKTSLFKTLRCMEDPVCRSEIIGAYNAVQGSIIDLQRIIDKHSGKPTVDLAFGIQRLSKFINDPINSN